MPSASSLLKQLERLKSEYGGSAGSRKLALLETLERRRLNMATQVLRLHEMLCFLQAYPDDREVLERVERMLAAFGRRSDLRRHRGELSDTGIAGTPIHYSFYWPTARWLARRCPASLTIDWPEFDHKRKLVELLPLLLPYSEVTALDTLSFSPREWLEQFRGPDETDATFVIRRFEGLRSDSFGREKHYESLEMPIRIAPGRGTPTRSGVKLPGTPVVLQTRPPSRARPSMRREVRRAPLKVRSLKPREGRRVIDMATEAMITRGRDLDAFAYGDPNDVRMVDAGGGLQFACIGQIPERRLLLECVYGFLTLRNGVPTGYVLASSLFRSSEIAYNVFETYRGMEATMTFGRVLAMARQLFGAEAFSIDPYQLGYNNTEGLRSGAWWFYYKLGFRPEDTDVRRLVRQELKRIEADPGHRSDIPTLRKLASEPMFLSLLRSKKDILGRWPVGQIGLRVARAVATRFGADRERAVRTLSREAARLLELGSLGRLPAGQRLAWERWSPLVMSLPGIERWKREDRRALARVVRTKGGRRESEFVKRFDAHRRLRRAIWKLVEEG